MQRPGRKHRHGWLRKSIGNKRPNALRSVSLHEAQIRNLPPLPLFTVFLMYRLRYHLQASPRRLPSQPRAIPRQTSSRALLSSAAPNMSGNETTRKHEAQIQRNPHGDFKAVEASRPPFDAAASFRYTQTPAPAWRYGSGANGLLDAAAAAADKKHVAIDPYADGRPAHFNYKLLISAVVPRPVAFVSTRSRDGASTNLAPFSYFQLVSHDPPVFVVGFASPVAAAKDTLRNLLDTGECVINIVSEGFVEAANSTSVNAPYGASEWAVSGLTPAYDCETVACARVGEAVFSIEGKLESIKEFESRASPGKKTGTTVFVEGTRFWAREDAINEERNIVDPAASPSLFSPLWSCSSPWLLLGRGSD